MHPSMLPFCDAGHVSQVFPKEWPNVGSVARVAAKISHSILPFSASTWGSVLEQFNDSEEATVSTIWKSALRFKWISILSARQVPVDGLQRNWSAQGFNNIPS
eukprot:m.602195 g.602195  ORF g.602195 m.602195 type:complete len:103 (+) comp22443_c0_seq9:2242-2550(+)